jgi:glucan phosphorylase
VGYRPAGLYEADAELREVIDLIRAGFFSHGDTELFRPLIDNLLLHDPYLVLADFRSYVECQQQVGRAYAKARALVANVDPEQRAQRKIFLRPHHPRIQRADLARAAGADQAAVT